MYNSNIEPPDRQEGSGLDAQYIPAFNFGGGENRGGQDGADAPQTPAFNLGSGGGRSPWIEEMDKTRRQLAERIATIRDTVSRTPGSSRPKLSEPPDFSAQMQDAAQARQSAAPASQEAAPVAQAAPSAPVAEPGRFDTFFASGAGKSFKAKFGDRAQGIIEQSEKDVAEAFGL